MRAEIISVGTELTTGQNLDTNCQWLSRRMAELGITVAFHTTVGDDLDDNVTAVRAAISRAALVIITGGLGPTLDDLTREALAKAAGVELDFDLSTFDAIAALFAVRNRPMPERNRVQALFPAGARPIPNDHGTAPGIWMTISGCTVAALPGVPREMRHMFDDRVMPKLAAAGLGLGVLVERKINTFGAGESHVEEMLGDLTARDRVPLVGITASDAAISLRIIAHAADRTSAESLISPTELLIRDRLGDLVYSVDDEELHDVVIRKLSEARLTLATAESITAGQVAERLSRVSGASACFCGGVVAYTNHVKQAVLGVPGKMIEELGAVSGPVAEAMAVGVRQLTGADIAVSTTGLAGPSDGGEGKPVGLAFIGFASAGGVMSIRVQWFGSRGEIQSRTAKSALNLVRLKLARGASN